MHRRWTLGPSVGLMTLPLFGPLDYGDPAINQIRTASPPIRNPAIQDIWHRTGHHFTSLSTSRTLGMAADNRYKVHQCKGNPEHQ